MKSEKLPIQLDKKAFNKGVDDMMTFRHLRETIANIIQQIIKKLPSFSTRTEKK